MKVVPKNYFDLKPAEKLKLGKTFQENNLAAKGQWIQFWRTHTVEDCSPVMHVQICTKVQSFLRSTKSQRLVASLDGMLNLDDCRKSAPNVNKKVKR